MSPPSKLDAAKANAPISATPRKTILIAGGGVIGLCAAYYAIRDGHRVTVLEKGPPNHDSCSLGNAGMIVPSHFVPLAAPGMVSLGLRMMWNPESPFYIKPRWSGDFMHWVWKFMRSATKKHVARAAPLLRDLHLRSRRAFVEMARDHGNAFGLVEKGLLMLCLEPHTLAEEGKAAQHASSLGIAAKVLSPEETAELDPGARLNIAGAVYYPADCHLSPHQFVGVLTAWLQHQGAKFQWDTEVTDWRRSERQLVSARTNHGEFRADEFVIAGGAWSPSMSRLLGLRLPMQAGKGYSLTLESPPQLPSLCSILTEARVAVTPMGSSLRFGGTMELAGLNLDINPRRVRGIVKSASRYFPEFKAADFENIQPWVGLRPCSPDGLPYLGRWPSLANLIVATGHAMMGLSLGPVSGLIVADLLGGREPSFDMTLLRPSRFS